MEMSMEMRIQGLDKMLEMRKQLFKLQDNLGVYNSIDEDSAVLIYSSEDYFEIARYMKAKVCSDGIVGGDIRLVFTYKDTDFVTYILPCEYEKYKNEISKGEENARTDAGQTGLG